MCMCAGCVYECVVCVSEGMVGVVVCVRVSLCVFERDCVCMNVMLRFVSHDRLESLSALPL